MSLASVIAYWVMAGLVGVRIATVVAWRGYEEDRRKHLATPYAGEWTRIKPDEDNWFSGGFAGLCGIVWPVVVAVFLLRGVLLAPPRQIRDRQREERIKELEAKLDEEMKA